MPKKTVDSSSRSIQELLTERFDVDFYQREYVWQQKQIEDLISDLSTEFLKSWKPGHFLSDARGYDPYFMGEIVVATNPNELSSVIDGQQRITSLTLLFIYILQRFGHVEELPKSDIEKLILSNDYGRMCFNLDVPEREECLTALYQKGEYKPRPTDTPS